MIKYDFMFHNLTILREELLKFTYWDMKLKMSNSISYTLVIRNANK